MPYGLILGYKESVSSVIPTLSTTAFPQSQLYTLFGGFGPFYNNIRLYISEDMSNVAILDEMPNSNVFIQYRYL